MLEFILNHYHFGRVLKYPSVGCFIPKELLWGRLIGVLNPSARPKGIPMGHKQRVDQQLCKALYKSQSS